jgi:hypothetical protein
MSWHDVSGGLNYKRKLKEWYEKCYWQKQNLGKGAECAFWEEVDLSHIL